MSKVLYITAVCMLFSQSATAFAADASCQVVSVGPEILQFSGCPTTGKGAIGETLKGVLAAKTGYEVASLAPISFMTNRVTHSAPSRKFEQQLQGLQLYADSYIVVLRRSAP